LSDFSIFKLVAEYWGCGPLFHEWTSPEAVFQILKRLSRGQPFDFTGIRDYAHLDEAGGIQWPYTEANPAEKQGPPDHSSLAKSERSDFRERRLFSDGQFFTADGRARFIFDPPRAMPEVPDAEYPFVLLTGRGSSAQWHTGSRTDKSDVLRKLSPRSLYVEINPRDAEQLKISAGNRITVFSRRGHATGFAVVTPTVQVGQIFMPMHFVAVNRLTFPAFDPHSRQPSYKACAVRIAKG
jgi:assimilatory nitrate reductase catalytic subunit